MYDDINTFGPNIILIDILYHSIDLLGFFVFVFYISDEQRKKYHQLYMGLIWVGFINIGAWTYYFSPFDFAPGEGDNHIMHHYTFDYISILFFKWDISCFFNINSYDDYVN